MKGLLLLMSLKFWKINGSTKVNSSRLDIK